MRARVDAVFKVTIRTVRETIPKLIGHFLVRMSQNKLQTELFSKINENEYILDTLSEPREIGEKRRTLNEIIRTLKESLKVIQRDPDITSALFDQSELLEELEDKKRREHLA